MVDPYRITIEDGPMMCLWKALYQKGWLSTSELVEELERRDCHYNGSTLRSRLSSAPAQSFMKRKGRRDGVNVLVTEYHIVIDHPPPPERRGPTHKSLAVKRTERRASDKTIAEEKFDRESFLRACKYF